MSKVFLSEFEAEFSKRGTNPTEESIKEGILAVFAKIEADLHQIHLKKFKTDPKAAYVGACALMALILQDKIYIANLGDCQGVILCKLKSN